jgi:hypothetical protein
MEHLLSEVLKSAQGTTSRICFFAAVHEVKSSEEAEEP